MPCHSLYQSFLHLLTPNNWWPTSGGESVEPRKILRHESRHWRRKFQLAHPHNWQTRYWPARKRLSFISRALNELIIRLSVVFDPFLKPGVGLMLDMFWRHYEINVKTNDVTWRRRSGATYTLNSTAIAMRLRRCDVHFCCENAAMNGCHCIARPSQRCCNWEWVSACEAIISHRSRVAVEVAIE